MPDWSYHTLLKPILFKFPARTAHTFTLNAVSRLGNLPFGPRIIDFMGHMRPETAPSHALLGCSFIGIVGLGAGVDRTGASIRAFSRFGFSFLELGPISLNDQTQLLMLERHVEQQALWQAQSNCGSLPEVLANLAKYRPSLPVAVRVRYAGTSHDSAMMQRDYHLLKTLSGHVDFIVLDAWNVHDHTEHQSQLAPLVRACSCPVVGVVPADASDEQALSWLDSAVAVGIAGVVIGDGTSDGDGVLRGVHCFAPTMRLVSRVRRHYPDLPIIASGGVHAPADALALVESGANLVQINSGMVFQGPGLAKRINEAFTDRDRPTPAPIARNLGVLLRQGWFWLLILGVGMLIGGTLAGLIALTRVILPYDEAFLGMSHAELATASSTILPFMAHDRFTLAGTMVSIGFAYSWLSFYGVRRGYAWARHAIMVSATFGFASFFLFLGFGYFDPLHALVSLLLLPLFVLGMSLSRHAIMPMHSLNRYNDASWRRGLWAQLIFVLLGIGLLVAGIAIMVIGVSDVFVSEDLSYMNLSPEAITAINPRLVPLIAHDRAGFGGALFADGLIVLLTALWGFRQGERWLWWMLLLAGFSGFIGAVGVHVLVGYTNLLHLAPAFAAVMLFGVGLHLAYPFLMQTTPKQRM